MYVVYLIYLFKGPQLEELTLRQINSFYTITKNTDAGRSKDFYFVSFCTSLFPCEEALRLKMMAARLGLFGQEDVFVRMLF